MIIYSDIITGDELISSAYELKTVGNGIAYEVDGKVVTVKDGVDVDIGANPSAEEQEEAMEDGAKQVVDVEHNFNLTGTNFDKKAYLSTLKSYMKSVEKALGETKPDAVDEFKKGAQDYAKTIVGNFKNYEFLVGESMNPDGMVILKDYREDGVTPYYIFWAHGLKETKV